MWFCKHEWKIITETITQSKLEIVKSLNSENFACKIKHDVDSMLERKHIQLLQCTKCGKLRRYVENI